jgi:hypothetical protein
MLSAASGRRSIAVKETCICWRKWIHPKKGEECAERGLCRCLCRNPAILTGIARYLSVSLCVTCQRHDTRQAHGHWLSRTTCSYSVSQSLTGGQDLTP